MAIVTATEITVYTDISASAGTITTSGLIPIVQERIVDITNNPFITDIQVWGSLTFNATAGTIVSGADLVSLGFIAGDEVYIYGSYRNDGYKTIGSVTSSTITLATGSSVINEVLPTNIMLAVVKWPNPLKYLAAQMIKYDYDDRKSRSIGVTSRTLGPFSETLSAGVVSDQPYGYPRELIDSLSAYTIARLN
jgi:hypothetical protein